MSPLAPPPGRPRYRRGSRRRRLAQPELAPQDPQRAERPVEPSVSDSPAPSLGRRLDCAWESLGASGRAECPVCGGEMELAEGAGGCGACSARLR